MNLTELLHDRSCMLLDFDGPICTVFSEITDREVSNELAALMGSPPQLDLSATKDPFQILSYAASLDAEIAQRVEHRNTGSPSWSAKQFEWLGQQNLLQN